MQTPPSGQPAIDVAALARCAELDIGPERLAAAHAVLAAWIPAANELSRKMSDVSHQALMPVTVFAHAAEMSEGGE